MWGLKDTRFLGAFGPGRWASLRKRTGKWLPFPGGRDCSQAKQGSYDSLNSRVSHAESNTRRGRRAPPQPRAPAPPSASAAAASCPVPPNGGSPSPASSSSGGQASEEQDLSMDLDYMPVLGPVREALCVLVPALLALALYSYTGRWHGGTWAARVTGFVAAAACASLLRTSLLEREYKAREKAYAALGDGDSRFRPIVAASAHRTGSAGSDGGGHGSQTLTVHVKVKTGDFAADANSRDSSTGSGDGSSSSGSGSSDGSLTAVHCFHGFGANLGSYQRVQGRMAAALRGVVTAHDMPGFGLTQRPTDMSSYFLTFNGRLGRLVLDYELQQLGLMLQPQQPAAATAATAAAPAAAGEAGGAAAAARQRPIKRILVGHSLGGACAALEAVTDPDGLAGLVLVAPAIFAFPGPEFADVQLTPHRPGGGAGAGVVEATPAEERRAAAAQAAAHLGFEPSGCHVTDPPEVRRLYPRREEPEPGAGAGAGQRQQQQPQPLERSGSGSGLSRSGGGRRARRGRLLRALGRLAGGLASLLALGVLRLLAPVITLLLRSLVRRRTFWLKGLQQAYYNPSGVTPDIVDSYRMPQLVRGWEAGMVNFLLARLTRPRGGISELFRDALRDAQPAGDSEGDIGTSTGTSITGAAATAAAAAATGMGAAAAAAAGAGLAASAAVADSESSRLSRAAASMPQSPTVAPAASSSAPAAAATAASATNDAPEEDTDLASRLAALVAARRLPVLLVHGLYDKLVPASNSQRLARMLPPDCCELVLLDRCGHMPQEEMPGLFVDLVAEFAARVQAR